jgi:entericidin B
MFRNFRFHTLLLLAIMGLSLSACNTVEGAGRDIESAGEAVQDSAD